VLLSLSSTCYILIGWYELKVEIFHMHGIGLHVLTKDYMAMHLVLNSDNLSDFLPNLVILLGNY
jgi:hypothetical protein